MHDRPRVQGFKGPRMPASAGHDARLLPVVDKIRLQRDRQGSLNVKESDQK